MFADTQDDGTWDWVAGVTLVEGASVRLVPAEGDELVPAELPDARSSVHVHVADE